RVAVRTGDTLAPQRQAMTRRPPHVLITTPESLYILLTSERFRPAFAHTRFLIVDEIHALMGSKRGAHLALSLERLQALVEAGGGARPQRIGCSATVSPIESALAFLTGATARDPIAIDLVVQLQSPRNIAAALQRVGRAGHLLSRTSKGRIIVTRGEELLEAAAVVRSIKERQLDRIVTPEAPLDVLAQQVVAAVAAESLTVDTLHARFKNAAP